MDSWLRPGAHVHLIGIGGIGLSAIARVLHGWGYEVSGSDRERSPLTESLVGEGIRVFEGHRAEHVNSADVVVVSSAIPEDNPEMAEAQRRALPVVKREQFLRELTARKKTIAVAGTHGKTTTTAMISWIMMQAGLDPTFVVGGVLQNLGTNALAGAGPYFVIEADEYDRAFLGLQPEVTVLTAVEHDHPDCYPTFRQMREAFASFVRSLVPGGLLIVCADDPEAELLASEVLDREHRIETYGLSPDCDWWAEGFHLGNSAAFEVHHKGKRLGGCALQVPGKHNVLNALAAFAACADIGVDFGTAAAALTRFRGTQRRFEIKGRHDGVTVVDDYAHHPTEIRATLEAARIKFPGRAVWAVFQPHTFSRTAALLDDFAQAFEDADHVLVTGIYGAREEDSHTISGQDIVTRMGHPDVRYVDQLDSAVQVLLDHVQPGDVVITLGAGNGYLVGEELLVHLEAREVGA
ncbi:MAG: UDP-N-acetylmuramate--L-alanine ligase [Anaerolineae bacterium]